jgi:hypothetical protein
MPSGGVRIKTAGIHRFVNNTGGQGDRIRILETDLRSERALVVHTTTSDTPVILVAWDERVRCVIVGGASSGRATWVVALPYVSAIGLICTEPVMLHEITIEEGQK